MDKKAVIGWDAFQTFTAATTEYYGRNERGPTEFSHLALGFVGEAGEVANIVKKLTWQSPENFQSRLELKREHMIEEIGDALWYAARLMSALDVTIEEVMGHNVVKLCERHDLEKPFTLCEQFMEDKNCEQA